MGRPLEDIASSLRYDKLVADIHSVLETLTRVEKEIQTEKGVWYQMRIVPYRTGENVIEGTVVTFVDVSSQNTAVLAAEQSPSFAEAIVETVREPLLILDTGLHVMTANPAFYRHFRADPKDTLDRLVYDLGDRQWDISDLRKLLEQIVPQNSKFEGFEVRHNFPVIGSRTMLLNACQTTLRGEATGRILLAFEDITDRIPGAIETGKRPNRKN